MSDLGDPLRGLRPPRAPLELALRIRRAAQRAEPDTTRNWVDRLWASRRLRLAWLITIGVLLALDLALSRPIGRDPFAAIGSAAGLEARLASPLVPLSGG
jgi:hypothetical protein